MTGGNDATLQSLRLKYNAALAALQGCRRALTEASMAGAPPSASLLENEAKARQELDLVRARLFAVSEGVTGHKADEPAAVQRTIPRETSPPDGGS